MHRVLLTRSAHLRQSAVVAAMHPSKHLHPPARYFSASAPRLTDQTTPSPTPPAPPDVSAADVSLLSDTSSAAASISSSWHPFDLVSQLVENLHVATDMPYWAVIMATTVGVRLACVPLGVKAVQNSARMAAIRPKMNKLIEFSKANPNNSSYQKELFLLWKKNNVNPLKALAVPLFQLPLFITFFFGIRQMGEYYPALAEGGLLWFPDLVAHDPYFVLPVLNGASFLLMVELNAHDQAVEHEQAATFKTAMRALAFIMVPVTMYTPASVFMYWIPNNFISLAQTRVLKTEPMKKYFNIPNPPPVDPFAKKEAGAMDKLQNAWDSTFKNRTEGDVEVIDGDGSNSDTKARPAVTVPTSRPPTTYTQKPNKKGKGK